MITDDPNPSDDWASILTGAQEESGCSSITITPESIAIMSLLDCAEQLEAMEARPLRLALAAKSAHLALQAALTAALAGTANIGAHDDKLFAKHLAYLEDRGDGKVGRPESDRVMNFTDLLAKAQRERLPWGEPIKISEEESLLLERLTTLRHDIEHPKQLTHVIGQIYIFECLPVAARLVVALMQTVFHHLGEGEGRAIEDACNRIAAFCSERAASTSIPTGN